MDKKYNGPQSNLMDILIEKAEKHGPIDCVSQVYLARACLEIENIPQEVYVLQAGWRYEGSDIIGIYSTKQLAEIDKRETEEKRNYDFVEIHKYSVKTIINLLSPLWHKKEDN